jgi:CTP:molybdopterin cytidylyltransferase MocA
VTSTGELVAVVLAAGLGTRLRPLTTLRPKPLCPVDNVPLLESALARVRPYASRTAVNAHHLAEQIVEFVGDRAQLSVERRLLGTAGALGALRDFLDGADVLLQNGDAYLTDDLGRLVTGWDRERPRLLVRTRTGPSDFGHHHYVGAALLPGAAVRRLRAEPSGLYDLLWRPAWEAGRLELVELDGVAIDCGTPRKYLRANLHASGGGSVIAPDAVIHGRVDRCVVWPGSVVEADESLSECIRAPGGVTVDAR